MLYGKNATMMSEKSNKKEGKSGKKICQLATTGTEKYRRGKMTTKVQDFCTMSMQSFSTLNTKKDGEMASERAGTKKPA